MTTQRNLDDEASEYQEGAKTSFENELILNWYPKRILERMQPRTDILELGIGHGYTPIWFSEHANRHVVIDGSNIVIKRFKQKHPEFKGEIVCSYFEDYQCQEQFDYIVMGFVLEHVNDPILILKKYRDHIKPGGKLYAAVPNGKSLNRRIGFAMGIIDDLNGLNDNDIAQGHKRQYCIESFAEDIKQAGFEIMHTEGIYLKPLPLHVLQNIENANKNFQALLEVGVDFPDLCVGIWIEAKPVVNNR
jgi:2-polyprenyl-3-methyl-5-hydroxy-6-metoxy-1,4-benzoquinol methylase